MATVACERLLDVCVGELVATDLSDLQVMLVPMSDGTPAECVALRSAKLNGLLRSRLCVIRYF